MPFLTAMPSLFCLLVLSGEEVPDSDAEVGERASRHRPHDQVCVQIPPPRRSTPPCLCPHDLSRAVGGCRTLRTLSRPPPRIADSHRDVRHDRPSRRLRHRRPPQLEDLEGGQLFARAHRPAPSFCGPLLTPLLEAERVPGRDGCPRAGSVPAASTGTGGDLAPQAAATDAMASGPGPRRRRATELAEALLDAATVRFAREGYRGTSVADVCRTAVRPRRRRTPTSPTRRRSSSRRSMKTWRG